MDGTEVLIDHLVLALLLIYEHRLKFRLLLCMLIPKGDVDRTNVALIDLTFIAENVVSAAKKFVTSFICFSRAGA
jgi:hypothetical protein